METDTDVASGFMSHSPTIGWLCLCSPTLGSTFPRLEKPPEPPQFAEAPTTHSLLFVPLPIFASYALGTAISPRNMYLTAFVIFPRFIAFDTHIPSHRDCFLSYVHRHTHVA